MMTTKQYFFALLVLFFYVSSWQVSAATLLIDAEGQLTGALGVEVYGNVYNVAFAEGTCAEVFSGCDELQDFAFSSFGVSQQAPAEAIRDQVLLNVAAGNFDTDPALTSGCEDPLSCSIFTPTSFMSSGGIGGFSLLNDTERANMFLTGAFGASLLFDSTEFDSIVWARWTPVPVPAGIWLMLGALGLLSSIQRKHQ